MFTSLPDNVAEEQTRHPQCPSLKSNGQLTEHEQLTDTRQEEYPTTAATEPHAQCPSLISLSGSAPRSTDLIKMKNETNHRLCLRSKFPSAMVVNHITAREIPKANNQMLLAILRSTPARVAHGSRRCPCDKPRSGTARGLRMAEGSDWQTIPKSRVRQPPATDTKTMTPT